LENNVSEIVTYLFPSSVPGRRVPTWVGLLEKANINYWIKCIYSAPGRNKKIKRNPFT
jgi:hypothetical protein